MIFEVRGLWWNKITNTLNIAHLPAGMYVVRVLSQSGKGYSAKVVKK